MTTTQLTPEHAAIQARIEAEIAEHLAAVRAVEARCKAAFLPLLKKHGITRVDINHDGRRDEGMTVDRPAYRGDVVCALPSLLSSHYRHDHGGNARSPRLDRTSTMYGKSG